ncbi:hypothetical protein EMGBS15_10850 [Filimonas sp.]|nr:hypothetical protein EMGBS15_10850 [Filimonas sp.]
MKLGFAEQAPIQIGVAIFIDYNQNNSFTDAGELVYSSPLGINGAHTESGSIVIPTAALTGLTGLRVINSEQGYPITNPCLTYPWEKRRIMLSI